MKNGRLFAGFTLLMVSTVSAGCDQLQPQDFLDEGGGESSPVSPEAPSVERFVGPCLERFGRPGETGPGHQTRTAYDADGRVTSIEIDRNGDGQAEVRESLAWETGGILRSRERDLGADGTAEVSEWLMGRTTDTLIYERFSGGDSFEREVQKLNTVGAVIEASVDRGGDGAVDERTFIEHDALGRERTRRVEDAGGALVSLRTRIFDEDAPENEGPVQIREDSNGDGEADALFALEYDAQGLTARETEVDPSDGALLERREHVYDIAGNRLLTRIIGPDGRVEAETTFGYGCF
ncbi:MAG: hypothetical protein ACOYM9_20905 [Bradymonadia bacterium]